MKIQVVHDEFQTYTLHWWLEFRNGSSIEAATCQSNKGKQHHINSKRIINMYFDFFSSFFDTRYFHVTLTKLCFKYFALWFFSNSFSLSLKKIYLLLLQNIEWWNLRKCKMENEKKAKKREKYEKSVWYWSLWRYTILL